MDGPGGASTVCFPGRCSDPSARHSLGGPDPMQTSILITGGTGAVGWELSEQLSKTSGIDLVRCSSRGGEGVVAWRMGAEPPPPALQRDWDCVVHAAASTRWTMTAEEAVAANLYTTTAVLPLLSSRTHLIHLSTAFAVPSRRGNSADVCAFRNTYEWSKAQSERAVAAAPGRVTIVRVPLVIGRHTDGMIARFSGLYTILRAYTAGLLVAVIGQPNGYVDVVPVDRLCAEIAGWALGITEPPRKVVTVAGGHAAPRIGRGAEVICGALNRWRQANGSAPLDPLRIVSPSSWERFFLPFLRSEVSAARLASIEMLARFHPYLSIAEPLPADLVITDVETALETSVGAWAERHRRLALRTPSSWGAEVVVGPGAPGLEGVVSSAKGVRSPPVGRLKCERPDEGGPR